MSIKIENGKEVWTKETFLVARVRNFRNVDTTTVEAFSRETALDVAIDQGFLAVEELAGQSVLGDTFTVELVEIDWDGMADRDAAQLAHESGCIW